MTEMNFQELALIPGALDGYWLIACEETATVRSEFEALGIKVISCDLKDTRIPGPHYKGNVRDIIWSHRWKGIIAHPVCRYLTNSGVRWLCQESKDRTKITGKARWSAMLEAAGFFNLFQQAAEFWDCPLAIENPIPHRYAVQHIGRKYDQLIQPYHFGHLESKAICLWLRKLPKLVHTNNVKQEMLALPKRLTRKVHYASPSLNDREEARSEFFSGIAKAFAEQWG